MFPFVSMPRRDFSALNKILAKPDGHRAKDRIDGKQMLSKGVWLSTEQGTPASFTISPLSQGFRLSLHKGNESRWASLSVRLPFGALVRNRELALLCSVDAKRPFSCNPALRYGTKSKSFKDVFSVERLHFPEGKKRRLVLMPIDRAHLEVSDYVELHVFFNTPKFDADFMELKVLQVK